MSVSTHTSSMGTSLRKRKSSQAVTSRPKRLKQGSPPIEPSLLQAESNLSSDILDSRCVTPTPSRTLPLEIALMVIDATTEVPELNKWMLVSKKCYQVANQMVWSSVKLDLMRGKLGQAQKMLDRLLEDDCKRVAYVKKLCVQGHIWRDSAVEIMKVVKKVNKVITCGVNLERIFLHLIYFHGNYDSCKTDLRPLLASKTSKLKSLTIVTNPHCLDEIKLHPKSDLNLHLALYQTMENQLLPSRFLNPNIATTFRLTSLDIQNISHQTDEVIEGLLKNHQNTLRHLAASSYTTSRDTILLMGFPVLQSFLFHTFHCARHNSDRSASVHSFLTAFFSQQTVLRSVNIHVKNHNHAALGTIFPVRLPCLIHLAIRHFIITVDDLSALAARQPELETLAVGITLPPKDPLDTRVHNQRRKAHKIDYVGRNPSIIKVFTTMLPQLRFLTMDAYDKYSPEYIVDFFRDVRTFREFTKKAPPSLRLFAARFKEGEGGDEKSRFRTLRVTEGRVEELDSKGMKEEMRGNGRVGLGERVGIETRREEKMGVVDLMWRDLYGMPLWVM